MCGGGVAHFLLVVDDFVGKPVRVGADGDDDEEDVEQGCDEGQLGKRVGTGLPPGLHGGVHDEQCGQEREDGECAGGVEVAVHVLGSDCVAVRQCVRGSCVERGQRSNALSWHWKLESPENRGEGKVRALQGTGTDTLDGSPVAFVQTCQRPYRDTVRSAERTRCPVPRAAPTDG